VSWMRKALAQFALSRSNAALVKASGGAPRIVRGFALDPRFQYIENEARKRQVDWETLSPAVLRTRTEALTRLFGRRRAGGVRAERLYVPGRSHSAPGRLYLPHVRDNASPMLVYFHSGGGVVGSLDTSDRLCSLIARAAGAPVLSIEYRLAPEHKFPAGLEDALAAYRWAVANAARYGAKVGKAGVGGDSMGGNFAAVIAQEMKRTHGPEPVLQLLIYPAVDMMSETASLKDFADAFPLTDELMAYFARHYLPRDADPADPRLSPARVQDLKGLAPALVYLAGFDMLLDQGAAYADRLADAGVPVTRALFENLPHGFVAFPAAAPAAEAACRRIAAETAAALKHYA
jgi:acetyl esterase/lipase